MGTLLEEATLLYLFVSPLNWVRFIPLRVGLHFGRALVSMEANRKSQKMPVVKIVEKQRGEYPYIFKFTI